MRTDSQRAIPATIPFGLNGMWLKSMCLWNRTRDLLILSQTNRYEISSHWFWKYVCVLYELTRVLTPMTFHVRPKLIYIRMGRPYCTSYNRSNFRILFLFQLHNTARYFSSQLLQWQCIRFAIGECVYLNNPCRCNIMGIGTCIVNRKTATLNGVNCPKYRLKHPPNI